MASEKEAYKIFYSRGLAIYQIPIGLEPQEGLSASIEIENVVLAIEDYGQDAELKTLIKKIHGDIPIRGIEVSMHSELYSDMVGEGKLIDPPGESGPGTHTSTYTFVSPEVTQALMERIPLMPSK